MNHYHDPRRSNASRGTEGYGRYFGEEPEFADPPDPIPFTATPPPYGQVGYPEPTRSSVYSHPDLQGLMPNQVDEVLVLALNFLQHSLERLPDLSLNRADEDQLRSAIAGLIRIYQSLRAAHAEIMTQAGRDRQRVQEAQAISAAQSSKITELGKVNGQLRDKLEQAVDHLKRAMSDKKRSEEDVMKLRAQVEQLATSYRTLEAQYRQVVQASPSVHHAPHPTQSQAYSRGVVAPHTYTPGYSQHRMEVPIGYPGTQTQQGQGLPPVAGMAVGMVVSGGAAASALHARIPDQPVVYVGGGVGIALLVAALWKMVEQWEKR
jgi:hypothetical protein